MTLSSESQRSGDQRVYARSSSVVFRKTKEAFGGLSNMAGGFPLEVESIPIRTSEALYQALRFPQDPELQRLIIDQRSPMTAKMLTKPHRSGTRPDWDDIRVTLMRWCLRVKLAQNLASFSELLLSTEDRPIVEESTKDAFWGAKPVEDGTLVGQNVLGRLLMELREELRADPSELKQVDPLDLADFRLLGKEIGPVSTRQRADDSEPALFDAMARDVIASDSSIATGVGLRQDQAPLETPAAQPSETARAESYRKKLIEVALPLEAINRESAREKSIRHGHPSTLHLWWARRPLAACRAVLFASIVDDPSSRPDEFPTEEAQEVERQRLFRIIEELVKWANTTNETVLEAARKEILRATNGNPPPVLDPFCGGGSIPLEAQRLGLEAHGSDLNPVAVLITKALIELPPRFAGTPPINPESQTKLAHGATWIGAQGLAEDVRYYGKWMRDEAFERIGHLYPKAKLPNGEATVIAWLWARTTNCMNPACGAEMPLLRNFKLSRGKSSIGVRPEKGEDSDRVRFVVSEEGVPETGTISRDGGICLRCGHLTPLPMIRDQATRLGLESQLFAMVTDDKSHRYVDITAEQLEVVKSAHPSWLPEEPVPERNHDVDRLPMYGMPRWGDAFSDRQLTALTTFVDLIPDVRRRVGDDARAVGISNADSYADAIATYLAFAVDRSCDYWSMFATWAGDFIGHTFGRQTIRMVWDYAEANPFSTSTGNWTGACEWVARALETTPARGVGFVSQSDAAAVMAVSNALIVTDPPYYDNISYADVSDFFYVWLRRSLREVYSDELSTLLTPKQQELVATPYRFGGRNSAREHFESGLRTAFTLMTDAADENYPLTLFYAYRQAETGNGGRASTGWETMLEGLIDSGLCVTGTWPMRTERSAGLKSIANTLASSVVLTCRRRSAVAPVATRKDFLGALRTELPLALKQLQHGSIAPVDLSQAAIGPGMAVFSRYAKVLEADGEPMTVRAALGLINQALDEILAEQEGDLDADTRFAITWFEQRALEEGPFGEAEVLARGRNTSVEGMQRAGVLISRAGKVRLLRRAELDSTWDPTTDSRLTVWEVAQHLIKRLEAGGEDAAAELLRQVGGLGESARDLAYRLYTLCERKGWAQEALAYNTLVVAWPEIARRVAGTAEAEAQQALEI
jgi:putative DNA methylase